MMLCARRGMATRMSELFVSLSSAFDHHFSHSSGLSISQEGQSSEAVQAVEKGV